MFGDQNLVGFCQPHIPHSLAQMIHGDRWSHVNKHLHAPGAVNVIVEHLGGLADGNPVKELQGTDGCCHLVGRGDLVGDMGCLGVIL